MIQAGQTVSLSLPAECVAMLSINLEEWSIAPASPFILNADTHIRIDCVTQPPGEVTATIETE